MANKREISDIRDNLKDNIGSEVVIRANTGRKRIVEKSGIIEQTYPNVFVVLLDASRDEAGRRMSFSYIDVLTKTVELEISAS
ncbi:Veg family protein [Clostridia bacterium]|nr:Veg family protein [Clostridia bacterium]